MTTAQKPGGQHSNRTQSNCELRVNLSEFPVQLQQYLKSTFRSNKRQELIVESDYSRLADANRTDVIRKLTKAMIAFDDLASIPSKEDAYLLTENKLKYERCLAIAKAKRIDSKRRHSYTVRERRQKFPIE
ncbi:hypothetical protein GJ496_003398 [Pomphorhynchus laevis]|nr:hypothetical protein GJ496_003398 [Pomphorhynchus laevis]